MRTSPGRGSAGRIPYSQLHSPVGTFRRVALHRRISVRDFEPGRSLDEFSWLLAVLPGLVKRLPGNRRDEFDGIDARPLLNVYFDLPVMLIQAWGDVEVLTALLAVINPT